MEGLNNSNTATVNTSASSSNNASNSLLAFNMPLESFASSPSPAVAQSMNPGILAICLTNETSRGANCYWRAGASGVPDIAINDCATMLTGLSGSRASEQSRQVGISKETASFVREMMKPYPMTVGDAAHHHYSEGATGTTTGTTGMTGGVTGDEYDIRTRVDMTLTITSNDEKMNTWFGFKSEGALYLCGNGWDDMDIRESVVAALDLAEEQLGCRVVYLCLEKSNPHLYAKYLVLGMEL
ncbi:hypothetical protein BGX33_002526 [Mortierella sp. NVP41]|nr:hypothetical protein BGX33_002526 [Mortierella sp. NVP41]